MNFGQWIKTERKKRSLTQEHISTDVGMSQGTISLWENNKSLPSITDVYKIAVCFGLKSINEIPFDKIAIREGEDEMQRMSLYEIPNYDSVRTFEGKTYDLKGFVGVETTSGEIEHVSDLYYRTRTVVANNHVVAKRKNIDEELQKVKRKKIKVNH